MCFKNVLFFFQLIIFSSLYGQNKSDFYPIISEKLFQSNKIMSCEIHKATIEKTSPKEKSFFKAVFYFDELGILFIPKALEGTYEDLFRNTGVKPKRVYYYAGGNINEGVDSFLKEYILSPDGSLEVSGQLGNIRIAIGDFGNASGSGVQYKAGTGESNVLFANKAPWAPANAPIILIDVPRTAKEFTEKVTNIYLLTDLTKNPLNFRQS